MLARRPSLRQNTRLGKNRISVVVGAAPLTKLLLEKMVICDAGPLAHELHACGVGPLERAGKQEVDMVMKV